MQGSPPKRKEDIQLLRRAKRPCTPGRTPSSEWAEPSGAIEMGRQGGRPGPHPDTCQEARTWS